MFTMNLEFENIYNKQNIFIMQKKLAYCFIGMFLLISCSNISLNKKEKKLNLDHLMVKRNVVETLDSINIKHGIFKYIYVYKMNGNKIIIEDSVETPILFNDLDSTLYMNSQRNSIIMLDLIKNDSTKIIISDSKLNEIDIIEDKKDFVAF